MESVSPGVKVKRAERLPVVLSMPETVALLGAMSGTPRLMAALIYGGQEYLGHANVETTMICTHVVKKFRNPARSPLDIIHKRTGP
jgi:site-specific recombinase XerD